MKLILLFALALTAVAQDTPLPPKPAAPTDLIVVVVDRSKLSGAAQTQFNTFLTNNQGTALLSAVVPANGIEILNNYAWRQRVTHPGALNAQKMVLIILRDIIRQHMAVGAHEQNLPAAIKARKDAAQAELDAVNADIAAAAPVVP